MTINDGADTTGIRPQDVDPARLTALLEAAGWTLAGGRAGAYNRLAPPNDIEIPYRQRWSLLVPMDKGAPEYHEIMGAALSELTSPHFAASWSRLILPRLSSNPTDEFKFRKESAAPSGLISWRQGEDLVLSARAALVAGAKSHLGKRRRFSNRFGQFASRYLDSIFMGQTGVGSYIITAYVPVEAPVAVSSAANATLNIPVVAVITARAVSISVSKCFEAVGEALDHYRRTGSLAAFESGLERGISYDLVAALRGVTQNSDGGDISIDWDPSYPAETIGSTSYFAFRGSDAEVLEKAANQLLTEEEEADFVRAVGRVKQLTKKQAGGPGVFGLETLDRESRSLRVRLSDPGQYHIAVAAHDEDNAVVVVGDLERDGSLYWLYNAHIQEVAGPFVEVAARLRSLGQASIEYVSGSGAVHPRPEESGPQDELPFG